MFTSEFESFGLEYTSITLVFDHQDFLERAKYDSEIRAKLSQTQYIFVTHSCFTWQSPP